MCAIRVMATFVYEKKTLYNKFKRLGHRADKKSFVHHIKKPKTQCYRVKFLGQFSQEKQSTNSCNKFMQKSETSHLSIAKCTTNIDKRTQRPYTKTMSNEYSQSENNFIAFDY